MKSTGREQPEYSIYKACGSKKAEEPDFEVIQVIPSEKQLDRSLAIRQERALKGSITKGAGGLVGALGEICTADLLNVIALGETDEWSYDCDLKYPVFGKTDVKTKRQTKEPLLSYYDCSVWAPSKPRQKCDTYVFVRVRLPMREEEANDFSKCKVWLLGASGKDDYFNRARYMKKGSKDPRNNFTVRADCWNLPIYDLCVKELRLHLPTPNSITS